METNKPEDDDVDELPASRSPLRLALRSRLMARTLLALEALTGEEVKERSFSSSSKVFNPRSRPDFKKRIDV